MRQENDTTRVIRKMNNKLLSRLQSYSGVRARQLHFCVFKGICGAGMPSSRIRVIVLQNALLNKLIAAFRYLGFSHELACQEITDSNKAGQADRDQQLSMLNLKMKVITVILLVLIVPLISTAATKTLESKLLKLEVSDNPHAYLLTDKIQGKVLLESKGVFINDKTINSVTLLRKDKTLLAKVSESDATIEFSFTEEGVLTIQLKGLNGASFQDKGEHYYGVQGVVADRGEGRLDNRGRTLDLIGKFRSFGGNWSNARAPFYVTNQGYGVYTETVAMGQYKFAIEGATSFKFNTTNLTYHVILGPSYAKIMSRFNKLAGPGIMPPDWAFSSIWWRDVTTQSILEQDLDDLRRLKIPAGGHWIDRPFTSGPFGWGNLDFHKKRFPDIDGMFKKLKENNTALLVWITNQHAGNHLYQEGKRFAFTDVKKRPAMDMRNPEAYDWYKSELSFFPKFGVKGYKIDRGDEGMVPVEAQNEVVYLYAKMAAEGMRDIHGDDHLVFARNLFDKARSHIGFWNGDTHGSFDGLKASLLSGLRCSAMNISTYGSDTGGYYGKVENAELNIRWMQFSTYSTLCQILLDNFDIRAESSDPVLQVMRETMSQHHKLMPYTRSCTYANTQTGMTVMRPMCFEFPDDDRFPLVWGQFMYGPNLLVAPVLESAHTTKQVILPKGRWMLVHGGGKVYEGPAQVEIPAPLSFIPVLMREGAIIPLGDVLQVNNNWTENWKPKLQIAVYPANLKSSFDYYTGKKIIPMTCRPEQTGWTIEFKDPGHDGEVVVYCSKPDKVSLNGQKLNMGEAYAYKENKLSVPFKGSVSLKIEGSMVLTPETTKLSIPSENLKLKAIATQVHANIVKLENNARVYSDRALRLKSIPVVLNGARLIQTYNNHKDFKDERYFEFTVGNENQVLIAYDNRAVSLPDWMKDWKDTGVDLFITKHPQGFSLYSKTFHAGKINLGGNNAKGAKGAQSNYFAFTKRII